MDVVFTNCDVLVMSAYRGASGGQVIGGGNATTTGSAVVNYGAGTLSTLSGTSWLLAQASHKSATDLATPPTSLVNLVASAAPMEAVAHDSNGGRTSNWPSTNVNVNASDYWGDYVYEVKDVGAYVTSIVAVGGSFDYPAEVETGDLMIVTAFKYANSIPSAPATGWTGADSLSGLNLGFRAFYGVVPAGVSAFVPQIWHLMP